MFKALVLAGIATLALASDYPLPNIPADYTTEVASYRYYFDGRLVP